MGWRRARATGGRHRRGGGNGSTAGVGQAYQGAGVGKDNRREGGWDVERQREIIVDGTVFSLGDETKEVVEEFAPFFDEGVKVLESIPVDTVQE